MMKKRSAFSLIELLVAINIIAILSTIATTSYLKVIQRARSAVATAAGHVVASKLEAFASSNSGRYPQGLNSTPRPIPEIAQREADIAQLRDMGGFGKSPGDGANDAPSYLEGGQYSLGLTNSLRGGTSWISTMPNVPLLSNIQTGAPTPGVGDEVAVSSYSEFEAAIRCNSIYMDCDGANYIAYGFARRGQSIIVASKVSNMEKGEAAPPPP